MTITAGLKIKRFRLFLIGGTVLFVGIILLLLPSLLHILRERHWQQCMLQGKSAFQKGDYQQAQEQFLLALSDARSWQPREMQYAESAACLAMADARNGDYLRAQNEAIAALKILIRLPAEKKLLADNYNNLGFIYREQQKYHLAEINYRRAIALAPAKLQRARYMNNQAMLLRQTGKPDAAIKLLHEGLAITLRSTPVDLDLRLLLLINLSALYQQMGEGKNAQQFIAQAEKSAKKQSKLYQRYASLIQAQKAAIAIQSGDLASAQQDYRAVLRSDEKSFGPRAANVLRDQVNLAVLYTMRGEYAQAENLFQQALVLQTEKRITDPQLYGETVANLASLLVEQGQIGAADALLNKKSSLSNKSSSTKDKGGELAMTRAVLATMKGDFAQAVELSRKVLQQREAEYGSNNIMLAAPLVNLATVYLQQEKLPAAAELYQRAIALPRAQEAQRTAAPIAVAMSNLASLYLKQHKIPAAGTLYRRALELDKKIYGEKHPRIAVDLNNLGRWYENLPQPALAEAYYQKALSMKIALMGEDTVSVAITRMNLAALLVDAAKYDRARPLITQSLATFKKEFGVEHPYYFSTEQTLATLLWQTHHDDEAVKLEDSIIAGQAALNGP